MAVGLVSLANGEGALVYSKEGLPVGVVNRFHVLHNVPNMRDRGVVAFLYRSASGPQVGDIKLELRHVENARDLHVMLNDRLAPLRDVVAGEMVCTHASLAIADLAPDDVATLVPTEAAMTRAFAEFMDGQKAVGHVVQIPVDAWSSVHRVVRETLSHTPFARPPTLPELSFPASIELDFGTMFDLGGGVGAPASTGATTGAAGTADGAGPATAADIDLEFLLKEMAGDPATTAAWRSVIDSAEVAHFAGGGTADPCGAGVRCHRQPGDGAVYECFEKHSVCMSCLIATVRSQTTALESVLRAGTVHQYKHVPAMRCPGAGCAQLLSPMFAYTILGRVGATRAHYAEVDQLVECRKRFRAAISAHTHPA